MSRFPFVLVLVPIAAFAQEMRSVHDHVASGDSWFYAGDNRLALHEYAEAYALNSRGFEENLRMARVYNDLGRVALGRSDSAEHFYRIAIQFADSLVSLYPGKVESEFMAALTNGSLLPFCGVHEKIRLGKIVRDHARRALAIDSSYALTYVLLGIFEREGAKLSWLERSFVRLVFDTDISGTLEQSELYLLSALRHDPGNAYALYELYWTYKAKGQAQRAIAALQGVVASKPRTAREINQYEEAQHELRGLEAATR
ncbi:MAG TPA: hypothetical protein VMH23_08220 [Bacteroidota bacterium]|nr:hypothetical protein [Bacteroidota bacterium]